jgi:hypothetical protein
MYLHASPVGIQTPTRWNLIGHGMTVPPLVLSPSSILPVPSFLCAFIHARKEIRLDFKKVIIFGFTVLGAFAKLRKRAGSFVMSVRPSAWNNSAPTGRIFMKFNI